MILSLFLLPHTHTRYPLLIQPLPPTYNHRKSHLDNFEYKPRADAPNIHRARFDSNLRTPNSAFLSQGSHDATPPTAYNSPAHQQFVSDNLISNSPVSGDDDYHYQPRPRHHYHSTFAVDQVRISDPVIQQTQDS